MKSLMMRSIYAGLGLLGSGAETVEQLGRKLAKQAALSEKDGERIARDLKTRSEKAMKAIQDVMEDETTKVVRAVRAATRELSGPHAKRHTTRRRAKRKSAPKSGA